MTAQTLTELRTAAFVSAEAAAEQLQRVSGGHGTPVVLVVNKDEKTGNWTIDLQYEWKVVGVTVPRSQITVRVYGSAPRQSHGQEVSASYHVLADTVRRNCEQALHDNECDFFRIIQCVCALGGMLVDVLGYTPVFQKS